MDGTTISLERQELDLARVALTFMAVATPLDVIPVFGGDSSITWLTGLALAAAGLWQIAASGRVRSATPGLLLITAFSAWALAAVLWAHDSDVALRRFTTNAQLLAFVWLAWQIARTRRDVKLLAGGYVAGCAVAALAAWYSFASGVSYADTAQDIWVDDERYAAFGFDPNDMGVTLALAIPMAAYLALSGNRRWRGLWLAYVPLALSGIGLSGSRGAMLTSAVAILCILVWLGRKSRVAAVAVAATLVGALTVVAVSAPETWERIFTLRQALAGGTMGERVPVWRAGLAVFLDHPLIGAGTGQFRVMVVRYLGYPMEAHNAFISVLVQLGVPGLLLFVGAFGAAMWAVLPSAREDRAFVLSLVATLMVGASSLTWELRKATWFVLLVACVVGQLTPARRAERDGDELTPLGADALRGTARS